MSILHYGDADYDATDRNASKLEHKLEPYYHHPSSSNTSPNAFSELIQPLLRQDVAIGTLQHSFQAAETPQDTRLQQQPENNQKITLTTLLKRN